MRLCRLLLLQLLLLLQEVHPARNLITRGFVYGGRILKIIAMSAIFKYFLFKVILSNTAKCVTTVSLFICLVQLLQLQLRSATFYSGLRTHLEDNMRNLAIFFQFLFPLMKIYFLGYRHGKPSTVIPTSPHNCYTHITAQLLYPKSPYNCYTHITV